MGCEHVDDVEEGVGVVDIGAVRWRGSASRFCSIRSAWEGFCAERGDDPKVELERMTCQSTCGSYVRCTGVVAFGGNFYSAE